MLKKVLKYSKTISTNFFLTEIFVYFLNKLINNNNFQVIVFSPFVEGCAYVCSGNQKRGKLSVVQLCEKNVHLNALDLEVKKKFVLEIHVFNFFLFLSLIVDQFQWLYLHLKWLLFPFFLVIL